MSATRSIFPPSGLNIPMPTRSVIASAITGSSIVTGDYNQVATTLRGVSGTHVQPPAADSVDVGAELAALRALLMALPTPDRGKLGRALEDAQEDSAKPDPDKPEIASHLERALKIAKAAPGFLDRANAIQASVVTLAGWLGPAAKGALALLGLAV